MPTDKTNDGVLQDSLPDLGWCGSQKWQSSSS
jgi:hypothetical protein